MSLDKLKPFVNDPLLWKAFEEYLEGKIKVAQNTLNNAIGVELIYREQGRIAALNKLFTLRDEVNGPERQGKLF